ncbi:MAG: UDP-N-acetylmuramoyl-tripeptide--D-alanyl-D-alanine ligase, partial [Candidatus Omnitrophica bacterium]|nr:UDP-N-acetylmuramoyl-tripeptide--D-alanyl-D-alanine ligase [Candidatus Omnitrophota bacterium]
MKVSELIKITKGTLIAGQLEAKIDLGRVSTDSRSVKKGDFFIALKGPKFDGNAFLGEVFRKGASGALTSEMPWGLSRDKKTIIRSSDTTKAFQDMARFHRQRFKIPVICVTGSNGKTTVKEMAWRILSSRYRVLKNEGTKNNHIGVPQTLLKLDDGHDMAVLELGTNHPGEIGLLSSIARPTAAVITNIGPSHLEFLQDLEGVFNAKKEMLKHLAKRAPLIINGDDPFLSEMRTSRFRILKFGFGASNDYRTGKVSLKRKGLEFRVNDKYDIRLNVLGRHNVLNALAAMAVASCFKIDHKTMKKYLMVYKPVSMRCEIRDVDGLSIIDDAYNSNPLSMDAALEMLKEMPAKSRWIVSGDMLELGKKARVFHEELGGVIARSGIEGLLTYGKLSRHTSSEAKRQGMAPSRIWHCSSHDEMAGILRRIAIKGDAI